METQISVNLTGSPAFASKEHNHAHIALKGQIFVSFDIGFTLYTAILNSVYVSTIVYAIYKAKRLKSVKLKCWNQTLSAVNCHHQGKKEKIVRLVALVFCEWCSTQLHVDDSFFKDLFLFTVMTGFAHTPNCNNVVTGKRKMKKAKSN